MKRLWLAVGVLVAAISLCAVTQRYQHVQIDALSAQLDLLETAVRTDGTENTVGLAQQFLAEYEQRTRLFPCFMSHNDLSGCYETVAALPTLLETGHTEEVYQEISRCRAQLKRLREVEAPSLQNVL